MKNKFLSILLFITSFHAIHAQNQITGTIYNKDGSSAIPGIHVYLENTNYGTYSNGGGVFELEDIPNGEFTMVVSGVGYQEVRKKIALNENTPLKLELNLVESITTLQEVSILANRTRSLKDIPGSMAYISPKEIEKFQYTDVNRILRNVPGINIQEEDGFGLRPNIGLRGTGVERSSKITVMEDGILMAPAPYVAPAAYYFPTIGRMNGVEILKGSSQIKYGPYTTGGAINLLSTPVPTALSGKLNLIGGSFNTTNLHAVIGNKHGQVSYVVETFQYGSDGFKNLNNGGSTGFNKKDYLAKIKFNSKEKAKYKQSLLFKIGRSEERSNETYLGLTEEDFKINPYKRYAASQLDEMVTKQEQYSLSHSIVFSENIRLQTTLYRSDLYRNWYKLDKVSDSLGNLVSINNLLENPNNYNDAFNVLNGDNSQINNALFIKANNREYYAQGIQTQIGVDFKTKDLTHSIDVGLRAHQDQMDRFQWIDAYAMDNGNMELTQSGEPGTESNRIETANAIAGFIQYQLKFKNWTIHPGLRYENITILREDYGKNDVARIGFNLNKRENSLDVFIPGISVDYRFNNYINAFVGVHRGFAPPGSRVGTEAEQSINYELGSRFEKDALKISAVVFYNDYTNLLGVDLSAAGGTGIGELFNGGGAKTYGLELQLMYNLLAARPNRKYRMPIDLNYTYTDAYFINNFTSGFDAWGTVNSGDQLPYLANHQLSSSLSIEHVKYSIHLNGRFTDAMRTAPGQNDIPKEQEIAAFLVFDFSAQVHLDKKISLFGSVMNLNDEVYAVSRRPAGLRPALPRTFNLGIRSKL